MIHDVWYAASAGHGEVAQVFFVVFVPFVDQINFVQREWIESFAKRLWQIARP